MWLVTGATGHIENVLVRKQNERGEKVSALILTDEHPTPIQGLSAETVEGDVPDTDSRYRSRQDVKGVFHLAGAGEIVRRVNIPGTNNDGITTGDKK